jgi:PDZ domain-containing secreted protein/CRP-like cAMP-binding protein
MRHARELARMPAFALCTQRELKRIAKWGDLTEVAAGHVVVRQDHSDWWFFVVVSGRVALSRDGQSCGELRPGSHFGESAVMGLRPQPATATATETSVLLVLGPRYVLTLLSRSRGFRQAVFPDVMVAEFAEFSRRMHDEGENEWRRIAASHRLTPSGVPAPRVGSRRTPSRAADQVPGRTLSLAEAVRALTQLPDPPPVRAAIAAAPLRRRWWLATGAVVAAVVGSVLFAYHPPRLVLSAGRPIDVVADVRVTGAATYPPSGHYLMLWVKARQPTLAGLLTAWAQGRQTVATAPADDGEETRAGRQQYLDSQHTAIMLALHDARLDPRAVSVRIRDRGFVGPSAGLVYALAVEDLLTPGDLTRGRVIGVTGAVLRDGSVEPIGWLTLKARGAEGDHASVLVVPDGQSAGAAGYVATTCGASTFAEALRDLLGEGSGCIASVRPGTS